LEIVAHIFLPWDLAPKSQKDLFADLDFGFVTVTQGHTDTTFFSPNIWVSHY